MADLNRATEVNAEVRDAIRDAHDLRIMAAIIASRLLSPNSGDDDDQVLVRAARAAAKLLCTVALDECERLADEALRG